jgi:hypothetical protein
MGPVMFVFDAAETEPMVNAPPLPPEVVNPFYVRKGCVGRELEMTIENAVRDGIVVEEIAAGSRLSKRDQFTTHHRTSHSIIRRGVFRR